MRLTFNVPIEISWPEHQADPPFTAEQISKRLTGRWIYECDGSGDFHCDVIRYHFTKLVETVIRHVVLRHFTNIFGNTMVNIGPGTQRSSADLETDSFLATNKFWVRILEEEN